MKHAVRTYGPALVSGVVLALCFPTFQLYPLAWVALVPLLYAARTSRPRGAALQFFVAGFVFHVLLLQWLLSNIMWAGGWAVAGQQIVCVILGLYWGLTGFIWGWLRDRVPASVRVLSLGVLWVAMEQLKGALFTGFGWSALAYSQGPDLPLIQWAAIGSAPLIALFLVSANALIAEALAERKHRFAHLAAALAVPALAHGVGFFMLHEPDYASKPLKIGIFQSNFPLEMKWDREYTYEMVRNAAEKSVALARRHDVDLVVWPEALVMGDIKSPALFNAISGAAYAGDFELFTGAARWEPGRAYNSSYLISRTGEIVNYYDKIHLAPFGEYVPLARLLPFVSAIVPSIGNMTPGVEPKVIAVGDRAFGPLICFEVLFPAMAERRRQHGADFIVVVTNLAWFGHSNAIPQELAVARLRAVETRMPLVHSANTGISGVFDPWGRFSVVDMLVDPAGRLLEAGTLRPNDVIMQRAAGVFDLAAPAERLMPFPPHFVPWAMVVLSAVLIALAGVLGRSTTTPPRGAA